QAGPMTVTTTSASAILADGKCSLSEAILNARHGDATYADCPGATGGPNTIVLPKGTQMLTASYAVYDGLPSIRTDITIQGNGARIVRSASAPQFRLFLVDETGILRLKNTTLSGGNTTGSGGAILITSGSLYMENCTITGNTAKYFGGGIYNDHGYVSINPGTISKNSARSGGGLDSEYGYNRIQNTVITGNQASRHGG